VKLLRAIQEQEFERVGGVSQIQVDVRIVAATNRDLAAEVKAGRFREDLFYRLNVVPIYLPPLRERKEDFEPLVLTFIQQFNQKFGKSIEGLETACWESLRAYTWPGNIRQLENALERMTLMSDAPVLKLEDLPPEIPRVNAAPSVLADDGSSDFKTLVKRHSEAYERSLIEKALDETDGNVTRAAERLGLSRKGLQLKMKELGLRRNDLNE
jgi:two-component system response regulator AtoC